METKYPEIEVDLFSIDGNAFSIMAHTVQALRRGGVSQAECDQYHAEATSGDYDNLLRVTMQWVSV